MAQRTHWLVPMAQRAGLLAPTAAPVDGGATAESAWAQVARTAGVTEDELAERIAAVYKLRVADLETGDAHALALLPERLARKRGVFPLRQTDREIFIAASNPLDLDAEQDIAFASGRTPVFEVATPKAINRVIDGRYGGEKSVEDMLSRVDDAVAQAVSVVEERPADKIDSDQLEAAPVVKLTNLIIADAVRLGASDIHLEPDRDQGAVRFRVDGVLTTFMRLPMPALTRVVSRIKVMSKLDIADRLRPQDGRARLQVSGRAIDLRISTVPTREAEKAVVRLLDPRSTRSLKELGVPEQELVRFRRLLGHRDGIVLVTGPTGSGKTTLLYAALRELSANAINIMTVEDPVEYELPGLTQIQVESKQGVTFASALRSILRQDPDVIFVGELRDLETAKIAVQASLTGHLVLATLHANDSATAVTRLADLGVDRAEIAATLRGAVAQRLMRRVCAACVVPAEPGGLSADTRRLADRYGVEPVVVAAGCEQCSRTGYKGRLPIVEALLNNGKVEEQIIRGAAPSVIHGIAAAGGMRTMRDVALDRVRAGETTLEEVERVLGETSNEEVAEPPPAPGTPHVLVVDDDAGSRLVARAALEKDGIMVSEAADGAAALQRLEQPGISLVVLDVEMPKMGGLEALRRLRGSLSTASLPVLVMTSLEDEETEVAAMEAGANDYVRKPVNPVRFVARIKAALKRAAT